MLEVELFVSLFFAIACLLLAERKNRSKIGWAILGFLFNIWSLLILAILDKK